MRGSWWCKQCRSQFIDKEEEEEEENDDEKVDFGGGGGCRGCAAKRWSELEFFDFEARSPMMTMKSRK